MVDRLAEFTLLTCPPIYENAIICLQAYDGRCENLNLWPKNPLQTCHPEPLGSPGKKQHYSEEVGRKIFYKIRQYYDILQNIGNSIFPISELD